MNKLCARIEQFALSEVYAPVLFLLIYGLVVMDAVVLALCALLLIECILCLSCRDLVPMLLPLLLIFCLSPLTANRFTPASTVLTVICAIPCLPILVFRLIKTAGNIRLGSSFPGMVAVSLALLLGGLGRISAAEYFSIGSLYHILFLGPGMLFLYLFFKANARVPRRYDVADRLAGAFYAAELFLAFLILRAYVLHADILIGGGEIDTVILNGIPWRNLAANLMVLFLPFVFYYARRHHPVHLLAALLVYVTMIMSGSRGAALCGAIGLFLGILYYVWGHRRRAITAALLLLVAIFFAFLYRGELLAVLNTFFGFHHFGSNGDHFVELDGFNIFNEARFKLMCRSIEDFLNAPIFGQGLGQHGNYDLYAPPAPIMISWYHSAIPQIIGSMGLVGILAYGYQLFLRLRLVKEAKQTPFTYALFLGYAALLVYSMLDPGMFSPFPYTALGTLFIVLLEEQAGEKGELTAHKNPVTALSSALSKRKKGDGQ